MLKVIEAEEEHLCVGVNVLDFSAVTAGTWRSQHRYPSYRDAIPSLIHLQHRGLELADEVVASITVVVIAHNLGQVQYGHPRAVPGCALSLFSPEQTSCLLCGHFLLVSLGFLSCLLQDCWKSRLKFPKDEGCAGYPTHPASVPPLVRPGPSAILSSNSAVLYIAGLLGVGILPKS